MRGRPGGGAPSGASRDGRFPVTAGSGGWNPPGGRAPLRRRPPGGVWVRAYVRQGLGEAALYAPDSS